MRDIVRNIQNYLLRQKINLSRKAYVGSHSMIRHANLQQAVTIGRYCDISASFVGKGTYFGDYVSLPFCQVGKFCSIARGVTLAAGKHPMEFVSMHPALFSGKYRFDMGYIQKPLEFEEMSFADDKHKFYFEIGNDVWIATNAILLSTEKCIRIGDGAIIGAGAVVTKNVPAYSIVVGNPGRIIGYRFNKEIIDKLEAIKWWDKSDDWIKKNIKHFISPQDLIEKCSISCDIK